MKPRFSIRYKFLTVISALLAGCVLLYLLIAVRIFKTDKTELVFDLNRSMVSNVSSEIETQFDGISDKLELFALLSQEKGATQTVTSDLLKKDSDIVFVSLIKSPSSSGGRRHVFFNRTFLETYNLDEEFFENRLRSQKPIPYKSIQQNGEEIWNATIRNGPALIGYGRSVIREDDHGNIIDRMAVVSYIRADRILKALSLVQLSDVYVINSRGRVLVHSDPMKMIEGMDLRGEPLVDAAIQSSVKTSVLQFKQNQEDVLGAYSKSYNDRIIVLAQAGGKKAFSAVTDLVRRSLLFGLIVVTVAFIVAVLLSRSLTKPIATLLGGMEKVSEGDLNTQIDVKSKDEIAILANSFNSMISDLKDSRQKLEESNRELENKVKERTRQLELQNQAVKEAQEALLRTTRLAAVGEIAGRAAHEVLNPLTSLMTRVQQVQRRLKEEIAQGPNLLKEIQTAWIKDKNEGGFVKLIDGWEKPSQVNQKISMWEEDMNNMSHVVKSWEEQVDKLMQDSEFVISEGNRINKIVGGMRSLSVVRGNKQKLSGHQLLNECVNIMADLFNQNDIHISKRFSAEEFYISVDRDEFIQSVTNLLRNSLQAINAAKASGPFKGQVELVTVSKDGQFLIDIVDNGVGISADNQVKLFESQFSTKSHEEGTGLGLSISRRFMRAFGGDIQFVESMPLVKTVFRITLPVAEDIQEVAA